MNSQIAAKYYFDEEIFKSEQKKIFGQTWIFAAFLHDLQAHNDFVTLTINDIPIVVQNFKGTIKAFLNVCSHRFSIIQQEEFGNRPLQCPYHGWTYSNEGIPTGIPNKPLFKNYTHEEQCEMRLKEYKVEICGSLVFVTLVEEPIPLTQYLGDYYPQVEHLSSAFGRKIDVNSFVINANWKVIVENTMEGYHLPLVHKETLAKLIPKANIDELKFDFSTPPHSFGVTPLNVKESSKSLFYLHKPFHNRPWKFETYIHYLIYPTLLISSSYGTTFNATFLRPLTANSTLFVSNVFLSKLDEGYTHDDVSDYVNTAIAYNRQIFDEDKIACEGVQRGARVTSQPGALSLEEKRVSNFQEQYLSYIKE